MSDKWALVHWTDSNTTTILECSNLNKICKVKNLEGWQGELPWVEDGSMVFYDATVLKVSQNRKSLEILKVSEGKILTEGLLRPELHEEKRELNKKKSALKDAKSKGQYSLDIDACTSSKLLEISDSDSDSPLISLLDNKNNSKHQKVQEEIKVIPSSSQEKCLRKDMRNLKESEPSKPSVSDATETTRSFPRCQRCKECPCQQGISTGGESALKTVMAASKPLAGHQHKHVAVLDSMIELVEGSGVAISSRELVKINTHAGKNRRSLLRGLLVHLMGGEEQLIDYSAEGSRSHKAIPSPIREAISSYVSSKLGPVSTVELNDVINKKCQLVRHNAKLSEADRETEREKRRISSKCSRDKMKKNKTIETGTEKAKVAAAPVLAAQQQCHSQSHATTQLIPVGSAAAHVSWGHTQTAFPAPTHSMRQIFPDGSSDHGLDFMVPQARSVSAASEMTSGYLNQTTEDPEFGLQRNLFQL